MSAAQLDSTETETEISAETPPRKPHRLKAWIRIHRLTVALLLSLTATLTLLAVSALLVYRPLKAADPAAMQSALNAASEGTVALLSYAPETVATDIGNAKSHLTGDFRTYYDEFSGQFVEPASKQRGVKNSASIVRSAVSEIGADRAKVLVFINQQSTSIEKPQAVVTNSSVLVTLTKVDGKWLISAFEPNPV